MDFDIYIGEIIFDRWCPLTKVYRSTFMVKFSITPLNDERSTNETKNFHPLVQESVMDSSHYST